MFPAASRFLRGWELCGTQSSTEMVPKVQLAVSCQSQRCQVGLGRKVCQDQEGTMQQSNWLLWHIMILLL